MRIWQVIIFVCTYTLAYADTASTVGLKLVFEDNFDLLDTAHWLIENDFDHYGEPQVYTTRSENVDVRNGNLELTVRKEHYGCNDVSLWACNKPEYGYTSGWIETKVCNPHFGYIESRIKIPHGQGLWPAFWTYIAEGSADALNAAEIDIFEMEGNYPPTQMGTNMHLRYCNSESYDWDEASNTCLDLPDYGKYLKIPDYSEDFHVYGLQWTPSKIRWFVDGIMLRESTNPGITDQVRLILNMAILPWSLPYSTTAFPSTMYIDYVRVFEYEYLDELLVYPNPAQNTIQIRTCNDLESISAINSSGIEVLRMDNVHAYSVTIQVSGWAKGFYILIAQTDYNRITQKIYIE